MPDVPTVPPPPPPVDQTALLEALSQMLTEAMNREAGLRAQLIEARRRPGG